jgi:hypothetical protein
MGVCDAVDVSSARSTLSAEISPAAAKLEVDTDGTPAQVSGLVLLTSSVTLPSNPTATQQAVIDVYVEIPPSATIRAAGYEAALFFAGNPAGIRFTGANVAVSPHSALFPGQTPIVVSSGSRLSVTDFLSTGDVRITNGAGLFRAIVQIDPGVSGQFNLAFDAQFTNVADRLAEPVPIEGFEPGSILVGTAVTPTMSISDVTIEEGSTGVKDAIFTVSLSQATTSPVSVSFVTIPGTATEGVDYSFAGGQLSFAAGQTSRTIQVTIVGDTNIEADETFTVQLSSPVGATLADAIGQGTILDDDELVETFPWQNPANSFDVNNSGTVSAIDVLVIINEINANGPRNLLVPPVPPTAPPPYYDANGDNALSSGDALAVINAINGPPVLRSKVLLETQSDVDAGLIGLSLAALAGDEAETFFHD